MFWPFPAAYQGCYSLQIYDLPTDITYGYTYDVLGNIATYTENGTTYTYTYDAQNQLTSVKTNGTTTHQYTYDAAGNILTASDGTGSHTYTYGNTTWRDLLTKYDGQTISYDGAGNPTSYYNGARWTMTWAEGRRLTAASKTGTSLSFTYDSDGLRLSKNVNGTVHNYSYAGNKLMRETWGSNTLDFFYDSAGIPYALKYNGTLYYYITNLQGDVLKIVNTSGTPVVSYSYDPYGKLIGTSDTSGVSLGTVNPLRYRGYVYDTETGMYYLQSRYYDPSTCRFINADAYTSTGQGILGNNMFSYCGNNPVFREDDGGEFWNVVIGAVVGAIVGAATTAIKSYKETGKVDIGQTIISGAVGAVSGAIAATGLGMGMQAALTAGAAFIGDVATQKVCEGKSWDKINYTKAAYNGILAGGTSLIGSVLGGITSAGHTLKGNSMFSAGQDKLLAGYVRQSLGQSASKFMKQGLELVSTGMKYINTGRGISSVTGTILTWGVGLEYSWS